MNIYIYNFALVLFILLPFNLGAQAYFDIAKINFEHSEYSPENAPAFGFDKFRAKINLGVELKSENYILAAYSGEVFKFRDMEYSGEQLHLYSNSLAAGYLHFWRDKEWSLLSQVRFKLNSDYYKPGLKEIQTGGWFMFTYKKSENLNLFAGMYYNQEVDRNLLFPIGGIHWIPGDRWSLYIIIPSEIRFEWILKPHSWYIGLESDWTLNSYFLKDNQSIDYFRKETLVTSVFIEKHITEKIVLFGKIGNYQINDYEAFNNQDKLVSKPQLESTLLRNLSLQTGLAYRLRF